MKKALVAVVLVAVCFAEDPVEAGTKASRDSTRSTLEVELEALLAEIDRAKPVDLFADGRDPDLVLLSSNSVLGEVTPCG